MPPKLREVIVGLLFPISISFTGRGAIVQDFKRQLEIEILDARLLQRQSTNQFQASWRKNFNCELDWRDAGIDNPNAISFSSRQKDDASETKRRRFAEMMPRYLQTPSDHRAKSNQGVIVEKSELC